MNEDKICAITFLSVHDVMKAEKLLLKINLPIRIIPVPKQVSPECGMALQVDCAKLIEARRVLASMAGRMKNAYRIEGSAFHPLEDEA